jgi:anti-anti-sigma factor
MSRLPHTAPTGAAPARGSLAQGQAPPSADLDDTERRLEDWLVCQLDGPDATPNGAAGSIDVGSLLLAAGAPTRGIASRKSPTTSSGPSTEDAGWEKLRVRLVRGIAVVRFADQRLLRERDLRTAAEELGALIRAGHRRIVLNFAGVERMSSQIVGAVASAHRRCAESALEGGQLRACGLRPDLAVLFHLTGLAGPLAVYPDERAAIEADWPAPQGPRPLPVAILSALTRRAERTDEPSSRPAPPPVEARVDTPPLRLIALNGRCRGRAVDIRSTPFVLGRDRSCQLQADWPTISRRHASIERRDGRVLVRDLGTTNGTTLNDRTLRAESAELSDGDRLQVGPLAFSVIMDPAAAGMGLPCADELVAQWVRSDEDEAPADQGRDEEAPTGLDHEAVGAAVRSKVIEGVLVVTPRLLDLDDESALRVLRSELAALLDPSLPRQVVINLECVGTLSSRAVGVLMAHFLRLDRAGGTLRLCGASAAIMALLDRIRLTMLVQVHRTVDDAVLTAWS